MRNDDLKQDAIERLKTAQIRYHKEIDTLEHCAAALVSLRYQHAQALIDELGPYLGSLATRPPVLERAFNTFNTHFAAFTARVDQCEAATPGASRAPAESSIAAALASVLTVSAIEALTGQDPIALLEAQEMSGRAPRLSWVRQEDAPERAGRAGPDSASVQRLLAGPAEWSITSAAHEGCSLFIRSRNRILAEEAHARRKAIEIRNAGLGTAIRQIERLIESTARHQTQVSKQLNDLRASRQGRAPADESEALTCTSALTYHLHALAKLLRTRIGVQPRAERPAFPGLAAIGRPGAPGPCLPSSVPELCG